MGNCLSSGPQENNANKSTTEMTAVTVDHFDYKLAVSIQNGLYGSLSSSFGTDSLQTSSFKQEKETIQQRSKSVQDQSKERFDHKLNSINSDHKEEIFTEFAPEIFSKLRKTFNIPDDIYLSILTCNNNDNNALLSFLSNSKSGQYFFFSNNYQFIIKTMSKSELQFLLQILASYYEYMSNEPNSLIARFYGIYKIHKFRLNNSNKDISFLISNNVFYSPQNIKLIQKYDLKGSTQGRKTIVYNEYDIQSQEANQILKDLNFIENNIHLQISNDNKARLFHQQINKDCEWLSKHLIMDYSLLVGIANIDDQNENENQNENNINIFYKYNGGILSDHKKQIYFIGIIDILQKYNNTKKIAGFVKKIKYEQITLSTVPPDIYAKRFCDFFKDKVV